MARTGAHITQKARALARRTETRRPWGESTSGNVRNVGNVNMAKRSSSDELVEYPKVSEYFNLVNSRKSNLL